MNFRNYLLDLILIIVCLVAVPFAIIFTVFIKIKEQFCKEKNTKIEGEVAVVTGSARGLGRNIAIELAKRGCHIAIVDIRDKLAQETAEYITKTYGVKTKAYRTDVTDYQQLLDLQQKVTNDLGDTTILVNNAGVLILPIKPKPEEIQKMININFISVCFVNSIFLPKMKEKNKGHILTISSISAMFSIPEIHIYSATKAALRSLINSLRIELLNENKNIKSTTVMPWFLNSNKQVENIINLCIVPKLIPLVESHVAAQMAVEAMLNGEEEITLPRALFFLHKIKQFFPTALVDRVISIVVKWTAGNIYQLPECQNIMKWKDTL